VSQLEHEPAHDIVEPRAQAAAGDDAGPNDARVEKDLVARPRQLECRQRPELPGVRPQARQAIVDEHLVRLAHEVHRRLTQVRRYRRSQPALAQIADGHVLHGDPRQRARRSVRPVELAQGTAGRTTRHRVDDSADIRFDFPGHEDVRPTCNATPPRFPPSFDWQKSR
jgi:hypothetical protein